MNYVNQENYFLNKKNTKNLKKKIDREGERVGISKEMKKYEESKKNRKSK